MRLLPARLGQGQLGRAPAEAHAHQTPIRSGRHVHRAPRRGQRRDIGGHASRQPLAAAATATGSPFTGARAETGAAREASAATIIATSRVTTITAPVGRSNIAERTRPAR